MKQCVASGGVVVNDIEVGDKLYEIEYGSYIECVVLSKPKRTESGSYVQWTWEVKNTLTGKTVEYLITEGLEHYGPKLYNELVYEGCRQI
jgi:hypothetical protein